MATFIQRVAVDPNARVASIRVMGANAAETPIEAHRRSVPTVKSGLDASLFIVTLVVLAAHVFIASSVADALHRDPATSALFVLPAPAATAAAVIVSMRYLLLGGATARTRWVWLILLVLATCGWPVACACSNLINHPASLNFGC